MNVLIVGEKTLYLIRFVTPPCLYSIKQSHKNNRCNIPKNFMLRTNRYFFYFECNCFFFC